MELDITDNGERSYDEVIERLRCLQIGEDEMRKVKIKIDGALDLIHSVCHPSSLEDKHLQIVAEGSNGDTVWRVVRMRIASLLIPRLELRFWHFSSWVEGTKDDHEQKEISLLGCYEIDISQKKISPFRVLAFQMTGMTTKRPKAYSRKES